MSSRVLSFFIVVSLSLISDWYNSQSVCDVWSLVAGIRVVTELLIVAMIRVWLEERS
jgi:hypothetical protein